MRGNEAPLHARNAAGLRPVQLLGRLWRNVRRARIDDSPAPARRGLRHPIDGALREASMLSATRFRFLNVERCADRAEHWNAPDWPVLWLTNLHSFEDLNARDAERRSSWHRTLIARWIAENPPGQGLGWEPYPTALRLVNWIRWTLAGHEPPPGMQQSLAIQARWLRSNLEPHAPANRVLASAKGLVFAGLFFEGPEAEGWLDRGLALLRRGLDGQVLRDGGHFEGSPMVHSLLLEDLLDLFALGQAVPQHGRARLRGDLGLWRWTAQRMRRWLACMVHPDGQIALFNDAAFDIAPPPLELEAYARRLDLGAREPLPDGVVQLADSGYVRIQRGEALLLVDVGEDGHGCLPGHAHADTLGFELSLGGRRWLVDSGTSLFEPGPERERQRSTAAHNTVVVDGQSSCESWKNLRVARRAEPCPVEIEEGEFAVRVRSAHGGYRRLPGHVTHGREWILRAESLDIVDQLEGEFEQAQAHLHLHPEVRADLRRGELIGPGDRRVQIAFEGGLARDRPSSWHPRFGQALDSRHLCIGLDAARLIARLRW